MRFPCAETLVSNAPTPNPGTCRGTAFGSIETRHKLGFETRPLPNSRSRLRGIHVGKVSTASGMEIRLRPPCGSREPERDWINNDVVDPLVRTNASIELSQDSAG